MRSSTSSSELIFSTDSTPPALHPRPAPAVHEVHRDVPARAWLTMGAISLTMCVLALAGWEHHVRALGYEPGYDDTPSLWVKQRQKAVGAKRDQLVLVGDSRTLFDLDLDVLQRQGPRPIQLATVGSNPMVVLANLAEDPSYAGTTLVGVTPALLAAPGGPPMSNPQRFVRKYAEWSPAAEWEHALSMPLQERLALLQQDDLSLEGLSNTLPFPRREGAYAPDLPPHFASIDRDRQVRMGEHDTRNLALMKRVQQIWLPLFAGPPKPDILSDAEWTKIFADGWRDNLASVKKSVDAITARGGKVFFVRHPSTGALRELEDREQPRATHWERLLRETGAAGIYDRDHAELSGFDCPEWSHLSAHDAVTYTRSLLAILEQRGLL